jgi:hypothetical protein
MKKIVRLASILTIFILIDLTATIYWIANDLGHEANPLLNFFLKISPVWFVIVKLGLSAMGIIVLFLFRKQFTKFIFNILLALNFVYMVLFVYHLWGLLFLIMGTNY